jgi:hypothetical protein
MAKTWPVDEQNLLNEHDRCDRCGARAYLVAVFGGGSLLLFCAHHARRHRPRLETAAVQIVDETRKLAPALLAG